MKKKFAIGLLLSVLLASFAMVGSAGAVSYSLDQLVALGSTGITVGDKTFYNFNYVPVGSVAIPATGITVVPMTTPALEPGLQFDSGWTVGPNQILDSQISFYVTAPASTPIDDVILQFNGAARNGGSASVVETVYANGPTGTVLANLYVNADGTTTLQQTATFAQPYTTLYIVKDISVNGGPAGGGGSAATSFVINQFSEVPIPGSLLLFAPGLLGLVGIRKRFRG